MPLPLARAVTSPAASPAVARRMGGLLVGLAVAMAACSSPAEGTLPGMGEGASTSERRGEPASPGAPLGADASGGTAGTSVGPTGSGTRGDGTPSREEPESCEGKPGVAGEVTLTLDSGGRSRMAIVHAPPAYNGKKPVTLVMTFHALLLNASSMAGVTRMSEKADQEGFLVVYPDGIERSWNAGECCGEAKSQQVDDVGFTRDLLAKLKKDYCIDTKRVFATGFSNGGFLSHRLACEMSDTFAAIAPVSGTLGIPTGSCSPKRPVPVFEVHGTADELVPYAGGSPQIPFGGTFGTFLGVEPTLAFWRQVDGCSSEGRQSYQSGDVTCTTWSGCTAGSEVTRCVVDGGGHQWPGGPTLPTMGKKSNALDTTTAVVDFFRRHPMR